MERLAYVCKVVNVQPIEGADRIVAADVVCGSGGRWACVVPIGTQVGDEGVVFLQDCIVPQLPALQFMEARHWRVSMSRFKGAPSEALFIDITDLMIDTPNGGLDLHSTLNLLGRFVGEDVSDVLGCTKYEKPIPASVGGEIMRAFPSFIPKTDELNFQGSRELVDALRGHPWYATVKMDGSSGTVYKWQGEFGVCSRNWELRETEGNGFWQIARRYNLRNKLPDGYAVQFELCGPGIQGNVLGLPKIDGFVFDIYHIIKRSYLSHSDMIGMAWETLGMPVVPPWIQNEEFDLDDENLRLMAEVRLGGNTMEGMVVRSVDTDIYNGHRVSFKVINLLYKG